MNEENNKVVHAHPDERQMLRMKMAADRTRLEAAGRLASHEADVERKRLIVNLEVWGIAAVAGLVVFGLLMREEPRRRISRNIGRAARHLVRSSPSQQILPRVRQFIDGLGR